LSGAVVDQASSPIWRDKKVDLGTGEDSSKREKNAERCKETRIFAPKFDKRILSQIAKRFFRKEEVSDSSVMGEKGVSGVEMVNLKFRKAFSH